MPPEVVLADNDTSMRSRLRDMLLAAGHNVECLSDDNEIISRLRTKRPHLLIVDKDLAPAGGIQVARKARELDRDLKIALLTKENLGAEDKSKTLTLNVRGIKKDLDSHFTLKTLLEISIEFNDKVEENRHFHLGKVLLVDDTAEIRTPLKIFLNMRGLDVSEAGDGRQALSRVYAERPRLAVIDERMPGMNGTELLKNIKEFDSSIQVILISGAYDPDNSQKAEELGACDYLIKPFSLQYLEALVLSVLIVSRKARDGKTDIACGQ